MQMSPRMYATIPSATIVLFSKLGFQIKCSFK
uniref:Uncharacterized protein n=1 Tax=Anguilla anguilla TaxID=7936 RepID=A0A0E9PR95_ANGAN